jgi:hypothetical protein
MRVKRCSSFRRERKEKENAQRFQNFSISPNRERLFLLFTRDQLPNDHCTSPSIENEKKTKSTLSFIWIGING